MIYASIPTQYLFKQEVQDFRELMQVWDCCRAGLDWAGVAMLDAESDIDSINMAKFSLKIKEQADIIDGATDSLWYRLQTIYGKPLLVKMLDNHHPIICGKFHVNNELNAVEVLNSDEYLSVAKKYMCCECEECGGCFACLSCHCQTATPPA